MTKPTPPPNTCDGCAKLITDESQYVMEVYQGTKTFSDEIIKAGNKIDFRQSCFVKICKNGYIPKWQKQTKNPQYVSGSKEPDKKYWIISSFEEE